MHNRLVVVQTEPFGSDANSVQILDKTLSGLVSYARGWPGPMTVIARKQPIADDSVSTTARTSDLPFDIDLVAAPQESSALKGAAVVVAMHQPSHAPLLASGARQLVWFAEFPLQERILSASIGAGPFARLRTSVGWRRKGPLLAWMIRHSAGLQSNGYPAHLAYGPMSPSPMLYFDTRVTGGMVDAARDVSAEPRSGKGGTGPLRLGFSGRHISAKGADRAIALAVRLAQSGVEVTMDVFGSGPLTQEMKATADRSLARVRFHGSVPFDDSWVPFVRRNIDVMVLPHVQGDPSGTYLESAALGVPVLGFANRALGPLVERHGIGWTVPLGNDSALVERARELAGSRAEIVAAGERGVEFMRAHAFESEFGRRIQHLREIAQV